MCICLSYFIGQTISYPIFLPSLLSEQYYLAFPWPHNANSCRQQIFWKGVKEYLQIICCFQSPKPIILVDWRELLNLAGSIKKYMHTWASAALDNIVKKKKGDKYISLPFIIKCELQGKRTSCNKNSTQRRRACSRKWEHMDHCDHLLREFLRYI